MIRTRLLCAGQMEVMSVFTGAGLAVVGSSKSNFSPLRGADMSCKIEGCDGHHCRKCGGHIPEEMSFATICDACLIDQESEIAEQLYGNDTDDERQEAMKMWDI